MKKLKRNYLKTIINNIQYLFTANMARRRFSMLNTIFPKGPDGFSLRKSVIDSFERDEKILDLGCGDRAQSLVDLRNQGYDNLYGIDLKPPKEKYQGITTIKSNIDTLPFEDDEIRGTIYSSYVFMYLTPKEQLDALSEIERVTGQGSRVFLGPFQPKKLIDTEFHKEFLKYKNPLFGFVNEMNKKSTGKWRLTKVMLPSMYSRIGKGDLGELYYRLPIPFFYLYVMYGRNILRRFVPQFVVKKDSKLRLEVEYYVTLNK